MPGEAPVTAGQLADALAWRFPLAWAEPWDHVGLLIGDPAMRVSGAFVTLDATAEAVARAHACGAEVLVTHHPPYLEPPARIAPGPGPAGTLEAAVRLGVAVISMHTNVDRSPEGAAALPALLGLDAEGPLESGVEEVSFIVTYAPGPVVDRLIAAMSGAGAGRLGSYEGCAFLSTGTGTFRALQGATPFVPDSGEGVDEVRIEMVCPRDRAPAVIVAARAAHTYEEPVVVAVDGMRPRGAARLGRVCTWHGDATIADIAAHVSRVLDVPVRVWGDDARAIARIAVANGSAGSLIPAALALADVLVAGEVRYHDALGAVSSGLAIIEAGHDVTEWPLVDVLATALGEVVPAGLKVRVDSRRCNWRIMESLDDRG